jgi:hypothetical protein
MKRSFIPFLALTTSLAIGSCSKEDTPPVITLNGSQQHTAYYGESFTDPGATATDAEDGDITSSITVSGNVGTAPNIYTLTYTCIDQDGNFADVQRVVHRPFKSTMLAGTYNVTETSPFGTVTYTGSVTADSVDFTHFVFGSFTAPDPIVVDASIINLDNIQMNIDATGGPIQQFDGEISDPGAITFTLSYLRPIGNTTTNCTATWVKQ